MDKIIGAVIGGVFTLLLAVLRWYLYNKKSDKEDTNVTFNLKKHPIFSRIDYFIAQIDYNMQFSDEGKAELITDVMHHKLNGIKENLYEFASGLETAIDRDNEDDIDLQDLHMQYFNRILKSYVELRKYSELNLDEESKETLEIFIKKFQVWHKDRLQTLVIRSRSIDSSKFYTSLRVKGAALFDIYLGIIIDIINDLPGAIEEINGELEGHKYKGCFIDNEECEVDEEDSGDDVDE